MFHGEDVIFKQINVCGVAMPTVRCGKKTEPCEGEDEMAIRPCRVAHPVVLFQLWNQSTPRN